MKNKIVIIGNGFDLSHGYNTDYNSFIQNIFEETVIDNSKNNELFKLLDKYSNSTSSNQLNIKSINRSILPKNNFFKLIVQELENKNWSDIEELYFRELSKSSNIGVLNKEFEIIKNKLEIYLTNNVSYDKPLPSYSSFFRSINSDKTYIINFNYTQTLEKLYNNETSYCKIINIHGQLNSINNPIIFGYAPSESENKELLLQNNNQLLINFKAYNYIRTNLKKSLKSLYEISKRSYSDILIIGHSCSLSDRNILNQLFNITNLKRIVIFYYKNFQNYKESFINVHRIMDSNENYDLISNFEDSVNSPQIDDEDIELNNFKEKINMYID